LTTNEVFLDVRRQAQIEDENMMRNGRQGKIIEGMNHLSDVKSRPALSTTRLNNVLRRNIENIVMLVAF
jgi:hypothetical protein